MILWFLGPRDHHERIPLQEGPEAHRWYPETDVLPSMNLERFPTLDTEPNGTMDVRDFCLCLTRPEETVLVEDDNALDKAQKNKQAS